MDIGGPLKMSGKLTHGVCYTSVYRGDELLTDGLHSIDAEKRIPDF
jgi:hypothetical protein